MFGRVGGVGRHHLRDGAGASGEAAAAVPGEPEAGAGGVPGYSGRLRFHAAGPGGDAEGEGGATPLTLSRWERA